MKYEKKLELKLKKQYGNNCEVVSLNEKKNLGCSACGDCCKNRNDILLTTYSLRKLSIGLNLPINEIISRYTIIYLGKSSHIPVVAVKFIDTMVGDSICPFLKMSSNGNKLCSVHEFKPNLCKTYPFGKVNYFLNGRSDVAYFLPSGTSLCCNASEGKMIKVAEWVKPEDNPIDDLWTDAFMQKIMKLKKNPTLLDMMETDPNFLSIIAMYLYESNCSVSDEDAVKEYLSNKSGINILLNNLLTVTE